MRNTFLHSTQKIGSLDCPFKERRIFWSGVKIILALLPRNSFPLFLRDHKHWKKQNKQNCQRNAKKKLKLNFQFSCFSKAKCTA